MRSEQNASVTHCEIAEIRGFWIAEPLEIPDENKKTHQADHFCLTELARRGYFAGSPPSGCGGKEAASATHCGRFVDSGGSAWGWPVESIRVEKCVWLEVCCGIRN
jgi:hypothetical protein